MLFGVLHLSSNIYLDLSNLVDTNIALGFFFFGLIFLDDETKEQKCDLHKITPLTDTEAGAQATVLKSLDFYNKER